MVDTPITIDETTNVGMDRIIPVIQDILASEAVLVNTVSDYSSFAQKGDKSVSVPRSTRYTPEDKVKGTALESQAIVFAVDEISLSLYKAALTRLEDRASMQAVPNVEARILEDMLLGMVEQLESDIAGKLYTVSTSAPDHDIPLADGYGLTEADFIEAKRLLDVSKVKKANRTCALHPNEVADALKIENFIQQDRRMANDAALTNGLLGKAYGFDIVESPELTAGQVVMYHQSHVGWALQQGWKFETDRDVPNLAWEYAVSGLYGVKELDGGRRGVKLS